MKRLVVVYDVSDLTDEQIASLAFDAEVQGEEVVGDYPHPDVRASSLVVTDPIGVEELDRLVEPEPTGRTWPTADELRAEGRDPDTGLLRDPPATGHYNPTTDDLDRLAVAQREVGEIADALLRGRTSRREERHEFGRRLNAVKASLRTIELQEES